MTAFAKSSRSYGPRLLECTTKALEFINHQEHRALKHRQYLGSSVACSSEYTPMTPTSTIFGCSSNMPSSSAGATDISQVIYPSDWYAAELTHLGSPSNSVSHPKGHVRTSWTCLIFNQLLLPIYDREVTLRVPDQDISGLKPTVFCLSSLRRLCIPQVPLVPMLPLYYLLRSFWKYLEYGRPAYPKLSRSTVSGIVALVCDKPGLNVRHQPAYTASFAEPVVQRELEADGLGEPVTCYDE